MIQWAQMLTLVLGGGFSAAFLSGMIQLILWKWNRKAIKADQAGGNYEMHVLHKEIGKRL